MTETTATHQAILFDKDDQLAAIFGPQDVEVAMNDIEWSDGLELVPVRYTSPEAKKAGQDFWWMCPTESLEIVCEVERKHTCAFPTLCNGTCW